MGITTDGFERILAKLDTAGTEGDVLERARVLDRAAELIDAIAQDTGPESARQVARVRLLRARLLPTLERPDAAIDELTTVVDAHPRDALEAEAMLARAQVRYAHGDVPGAEADVVRIIGDFSASTDLATARIVAEARLTGIERAVQAAERASWADAASHWRLVVGAAEDLAAWAGRHGTKLETSLARAMSIEAAAWRSLAALSAPDGDATEADDRGLRAGDAFFARFAGTDSGEIRALLAESESALDALTAVSEPAVALRVAERDLELSAAWGARPAAFFAGAALRRARALDDLERGQDARDQLYRLVEAGRMSDDLAVQLVVASAWEALVRLLSATEHEDHAVLEGERFAAWIDERSALVAVSSARHALARALEITVSIAESRVDTPESETLSVDGSPVDSRAEARESLPLTAPEAAYADSARAFAARFARDEDPGLRLAAARSLQRLAGDQRLRGHFEQAVDAYRELIAAFGDDASSDVREGVIGPSELNLGFLLLSLLARPAEAVAAYDVAIARIGDPRSRAARSLLGRLQASRATALTDVYDRTAEQGLGNERDHDLTPRDPIGAPERERIRAAVARGRAASGDDDHVTAIAEYDSIIDAHPAPVDREVRQRVSDAMVRKGYSLGQLQQWSASVAHHHAMLERFGEDIDTDIEKDLALALANLANAFDKLGRHEEEIDAYEQILTRWSDSPVPELTRQCSRAAWMKGYTEAELGRSDDAERSYRRGMRHLWAEETATRVNACKSAVNLSIFLRKRGRNDQAASAAEQAIAVLSDVSGAPVQEQRTKAGIALARAEAARGDTAAALQCYDRLLSDPDASLTAEQRQALTREHIQLVGGPFQAAWRRIRRNIAAR
ncbi:tetratricopeptide repeat protein [Plantibacter flavus]|uniref:hypothetical protein n=1 Tax=Plantibacter flavus TaxID=150123 RepID=UPI003F180EBF